MIIGGVIGAPFTLGFSLIATAVGAGVCAVGGLTSAGAGIAELCISKKKVGEIQKVIEEDNVHSKEIQAMWEGIVGKCTEVARKHSDTGYSADDVLSVLMVCCINMVPDRLSKVVLSKAPIVAGKAKDSKLQEKAKHFKESASHAMDVSVGIGSGGSSVAKAGRATAGAVVTALVVHSAEKGSKAVCHCAKMGGVARKVVIAAKVFRVATGINPLASAAFATVGGFVDIASLIYASYKIHKNSDSSAGKELIKVKEELEKSQKQLRNLKQCLFDVINSMES